MGEDLARPDDFQREEGKGGDEGGGDTVASTRSSGTGEEGGRRAVLRHGDVAGTQGEVVGKGQGVEGPHPSLQMWGGWEQLIHARSLRPPRRQVLLFLC